MNEISYIWNVHDAESGKHQTTLGNKSDENSDLGLNALIVLENIVRRQRNTQLNIQENTEN